MVEAALKLRPRWGLSANSRLWTRNNIVGPLPQTFHLSAGQNSWVCAVGDGARRSHHIDKERLIPVNHEELSGDFDGSLHRKLIRGFRSSQRAGQRSGTETNHFHHDGILGVG
jgi:hypothetical protein